MDECLNIVPNRFRATLEDNSRTIFAMVKAIVVVLKSESYDDLSYLRFEEYALDAAVASVIAMDEEMTLILRDLDEWLLTALLVEWKGYLNAIRIELVSLRFLVSAVVSRLENDSRGPSIDGSTPVIANLEQSETGSDKSVIDLKARNDGALKCLRSVREYHYRAKRLEYFSMHALKNSELSLTNCALMAFTKEELGKLKNWLAHLFFALGIAFACLSGVFYYRLFCLRRPDFELKSALAQCNDATLARRKVSQNPPFPEEAVPALPK